MFKQKRAFTLIELLIVIAIIGILATLAVVALQQARQNARDSKRVADVKQVHTALELFFNEHSRYPTQEEWDNWEIQSLSNETFMHIKPSAPSPADGDCQSASNTYTYIPSENNVSYMLSFCTGKPISDLPAGQLCATPGGILPCDVEINESSDPFASDSGVFIDIRDSQEYNWVKIGSQIWMAENLNYDNGCSSITWVNNSDEGWCGYYNDNELTYGSYGFLYQWSLTQENICPSGWHVPSDNDFTILTDYLSNNEEYWCNSVSTYTAKAIASKAEWNSSVDPCDVDNDQTSNNITGFTALPIGYRHNVDGSFYSFNLLAVFWSSSFNGESDAWNRNVGSNLSSIIRGEDSQSDAYSIRCVKD